MFSRPKGTYTQLFRALCILTTLRGDLTHLVNDRLSLCFILSIWSFKLCRRLGLLR